MHFLKHRRRETHLEFALHRIAAGLAECRPAQFLRTFRGCLEREVQGSLPVRGQRYLPGLRSSFEGDSPGAGLVRIVRNGKRQAQLISQAHEKRCARGEHHGLGHGEFTRGRAEALAALIQSHGKHAVGRERVRQLHLRGESPISIGTQRTFPHGNRRKIRTQTRRRHFASAGHFPQACPHRHRRRGGIQADAYIYVYPLLRSGIHHCIHGHLLNSNRFSRGLLVVSSRTIQASPTGGAAHNTVDAV